MKSNEKSRINGFETIELSNKKAQIKKKMKISEEPIFSHKLI